MMGLAGLTLIVLGIALFRWGKSRCVELDADDVRRDPYYQAGRRYGPALALVGVAVLFAALIWHH